MLKEWGTNKWFVELQCTGKHPFSYDERSQFLYIAEKGPSKTEFPKCARKQYIYLDINKHGSVYTEFPASVTGNNQVIYNIFPFSKHCNNIVMFTLAPLSSHMFTTYSFLKFAGITKKKTSMVLPLELQLRLFTIFTCNLNKIFQNIFNWANKC